MKEELIIIDPSVTVEPDRPMRKLISLAKDYGYPYDFRLTNFENALNINQWLYDNYNIWIWCVPSMEGNFYGYLRDLRQVKSKKQKVTTRDNNMEALTYTLLEGLRLL